MSSADAHDASTAAAASSLDAAAAAAAATPVVGDSTDAAATPAAVPIVPRMKKVRKRAALKTSTTAVEDDEAEAGGGAGGSDGEGGATSLHTIKLMQKLRSKGSNVLALGEGTLALAAEAAAAESATGLSASSASGADAALMGKEFGAEGKDVQTALIDHEMEKYVAEQLAARRALRAPQKAASQSAAAAGAPAAVNLSEDQLFDMPEHLKIRTTSQHVDEDESGERWLTGIAEVSVSMKDKMLNIEKTEAAKARLLREQAQRPAASMVLPANYNSNFKLHKKEWDAMRREEFRQFADSQNRQQAVAAGMPVPAPIEPWTRDALPKPDDPRALPGFLAVTEAPRREFVPRPNAGGNAQRNSGVPSATDDRVVDRFIKRFKYK